MTTATDKTVQVKGMTICKGSLVKLDDGSWHVVTAITDRPKNDLSITALTRNRTQYRCNSQAVKTVHGTVDKDSDLVNAEKRVESVMKNAGNDSDDAKRMDALRELKFGDGVEVMDRGKKRIVWFDKMLHRGRKYKFAAKLNIGGPSYKFPLNAVIID